MFYIRLNGYTIHECTSFNQAVSYANYIRKQTHLIPTRDTDTGRYISPTTLDVTIYTTGISPV